MQDRRTEFSIHSSVVSITKNGTMVARLINYFEKENNGGPLLDIKKVLQRVAPRRSGCEDMGYTGLYKNETQFIRRI